jgi:hypothetical protein
MGWTWVNVVMVAIGLVVVAGCIVGIKYREAIFRVTVEQNTRMYGKKVGRLMQQTSSIWGVVVPACGGIAIGTGFVIAGIFGHPH